MGNNHPHHNSREGETSKNETHEKAVSAETLKDQVLLAGQGTSGEDKDKDKEKQSFIDEKTIKETPPLDGSSDTKQKNIEIEESKEPKLEASKEPKIEESKDSKIGESKEVKIEDETQKQKSNVGEDSKDKDKSTETPTVLINETPVEDVLIKTKDVKIVPEIITMESQVKDDLVTDKEQVKISEEKNNVETKIVTCEESNDLKTLTESKIDETKDVKPEIQASSIGSDLKIDDSTEKTPLLSQEKTEVEEKTKEVSGVKKESEDNLEGKKAPLEENKEEEKRKNKSSILGACLCCVTPTN